MIDNVNLNVHIDIPIITKPGRGMPFNYSLSYDSSVWSTLGSSWYPAMLHWGWRGTAEALTGYVTNAANAEECTWWNGSSYQSHW